MGENSRRPKPTLTLDESEQIKEEMGKEQDIKDNYDQPIYNQQHIPKESCSL